MSIVDMNAESVISNIVEAMLPRWSDNKLGLLIEVRLDFADHGFADDGNTLERESLTIYRNISFLFHRRANYTKVFVWKPNENAKGLDISQYYNEKEHDWILKCDHDSCWRDAVGSELTDIYFESFGKFKGRMKSGKPLRPIDLYQYIALNSKPFYVVFDKFEQKDKSADRWSNEGKVWVIKKHNTNLASLEMVEVIEGGNIISSGILIKGSEDYNSRKEQ